MRFLVPITETDTISYGLAVEKTDVEVFPTSSIRIFSSSIRSDRVTRLAATAGWARDQRDSTIYTTSGTLQRISLEVAVPPAELRFYKAQYELQWYHPLGERTCSSSPEG